MHIKIKSEDLTEIEVNKSAIECLTDGGICEESDSESDDEIEGLLNLYIYTKDKNLILLVYNNILYLSTINGLYRFI